MKKSIIACIFFGWPVILTGVLIFFEYRVNPGILNPGYYPNNSSGEVATINADEIRAVKLSCGTYSQCHRNTSEAMKRKIYFNYSVPYPQPAGRFEVDHFIPLCMGGADTEANLWLQPEPYFGQKDKIEAELCAEVRKLLITPKDAQEKIRRWRDIYEKEYPKESYFGAEVVFPEVRDCDDQDC